MMRISIPCVRRFAVALLAAGVLLALLPGCAGYRHGSLMHPQIHSIAVGEFANDTEEAGLTVHLRQKLADSLMTDGSVTLKSEEKADAVLRGRILKYEMSSLAARRASDATKNSSSTSLRDTYQTTIYRTEVVVEFELIIPGMRTPVLERREVHGRAEYTPLADLEIARAEALRRAIQDAARQISAETTEAW
jgi:hypothetical protein